MMKYNCTPPVEKYIEMSGKSILLQGICPYSLKKKCIYVFIETLTENKEKFNFPSINKMEHYIEMKTNEFHVSRKIHRSVHHQKMNITSYKFKI